MLLCPVAPAGAYLSSLYTVSARPLGGKWQDVSVYLVLSPDGLSNWRDMPPEVTAEYNGVEHVNYAAVTAMASLFFDEPIEVRVRASRAVEKYCIGPTGDIPFAQDGAEITFTLREPRMLSIEPDGDIFGSLQLLAQAPVSADPPADCHVIRFTPGLHTAENSEHIVLNENGVPVVAGIGDNTWIIAEPGALVRAAVEIVHAKNVTVCGGGIFSLLYRCYGADSGFTATPLYGGFRACALPSVYIRAKSASIEVRDVILISEFRGICARNASDITVKNVALFSSTANADGVNLSRVVNVTVEDSYIRSGDDCFAVFTAPDSVFQLEDEPEMRTADYSGNMTVKRCIFWTTCRPIMIGGHASGNTEPRDVVENIRITDCIVADDAMYHKGVAMQRRQYWSGVIRLLSQSGAIVRNITVDGLRARWSKDFFGKPIHIEVRDSKTASYTEHGGYRLEGITIRNVAFTDVSEERLPSFIYAPSAEDPELCVRDVRIENVTLDGVRITEADLRIEGNTAGITVR